VNWEIVRVGRPYGGASKDYGVRATAAWGSTGTTVGDSRSNMFARVTATLLAWTWELRIGWKGRAT
jgi:hypothetical protein